MRFIIKRSALDGNETTQNALDAILGRVEDGVHMLDISDADLLEESSWYKSSRSDRQKILQEIASQGLRTSVRDHGPHLQSVEIFDEATAVVGRHVAHTPLRVLVENDVSDGALIQSALAVFATKEAHEMCFGPPSLLSPPALQIESRGGQGELKKLIKAKLEEAAKNGRPPRMVVVTDSDGEWIGDVKPHAIEIRNLCADNNIPCPTLNQRTAENYIPNEIWQLMAEPPGGIALKPTVDALMRLSDDQRDHLRFEQPNTEPWDLSKADVATLYTGVTNADRQILKDSALKGRGENMKILAMSKNLGILSPSILKRRDRKNDLELLAKKIENEL